MFLVYVDDVKIGEFGDRKIAENFADNISFAEVIEI
jgi:hypothetical protein